ncbi:coagulation factor IX-like isoform X2 [Tigriopus californicus]|uniref:coagulation factor IX-like isoform X2 n=1 Tax=Tigriopus californicus TaxID=6832 RepID=UPI0027DA1AE0|nr:coagulation factor IX-like isoform X2 [Tigriopus californicus]|eukprot:TCALIF_01877-PA protein Name:"Similar to Sb Serine proteinase stubble (Drosophila melanogaster)" AED:0.11 eAED:0.11 QI:100/0.66/0.5/1/0.66/0.75/4/49/436
MGLRHYWPILLVLLPSVIAALAPPDHERNSRQLTKSLMNLDLGYNVMNQAALRKSMGFNVEDIDRSDDVFEDYEYLEDMEDSDGDDNNSEGVSLFNSDHREVLPAPLSLARQDGFFGSGPNPEGFWLDSNFWESSAWSPFGGRPQRKPQVQASHPRSHPKKKIFDNAHRPELDFGSVQNDPRCGLSAGRRNVAQRRIVGGDEAGFGSFPWQAYIRIGTSRCGGSLVNEWYVVTAGHCVARARASQVRVTLGEYVLKSSVEPLPGRTYGASTIKVHPYFKFTPQADRYDVAVVRLNRRVDLAPHISPICLPPKELDMHDMHGWAAGWGALQPGSRLRPKTLQVVDVPMIDNRECENWHKDKGINVVIYDEMVCAGYYRGGKDSCQGDSGGPLMSEMEGRWTLIGIVSAGYSCAKRGQPGIYHRVSRTADWISYSIST